MDTVIYARVSTISQDYDRQVNELSEVAIKNGWTVKKIFAEKISGAKKNDEREALQDMISYVEANCINKVMVLELSRLGRDTLQVLQAIELLNSKGISVYIHNYRIETLTSDGKINPMSQFLITILAEVGCMEQVGRKQGYKKSAEQMKSDYDEKLRLLKKGIHFVIY